MSGSICIDSLDIESLISYYFQIDKMKHKFQTLKSLEANQWQRIDSEESNLAEVPMKSRTARNGATISANRVELPRKSSPALLTFLAGRFL